MPNHSSRAARPTPFVWSIRSPLRNRFHSVDPQQGRGARVNLDELRALFFAVNTLVGKLKVSGKNSKVGLICSFTFPGARQERQQRSRLLLSLAKSFSAWRTVRTETGKAAHVQSGSLP